MLTAYIVSVVVLIPLHHDVDIFAGSGHETISTHADADHCHHIDLSHAETCAVCSGFFGRTFVATVEFTIQPEKKIFYLPRFTFVSAISFQVLSPFFHRGPPFMSA